MNGAQAKKIASYVILPEIIPRAKMLFASGFGYIAFLMASIYGAVRLLPSGHPYLNPANIGKFGIVHAISEAANHLTLEKKNIDQIVVFLALLLGMVTLLLQVALSLYGFVIAPAFAATATSIFLTPDPSLGGGNTNDIAFIVLDQVFGIPKLFCTEGNVCTNVMPGNNPWPFHVALHEMLRFYSLGMLLLGVVIFMYYVLVVVGETATTGHPFGQRFQNGWAPIRLVVALGLLLPINYGLNSGQYIVLYAAKFGSGFATNGWIRFNDTIKDKIGAAVANPMGERNTLLAKPQTPDISGTVQMMSLIHACAYAYWKDSLGINNAGATPPSPNFYIKPYLVKNVQPWMADKTPNLLVTEGLSYVAALDFFNNNDIIIRFGQYDPNAASKDDKGKVKPICGDIRIPITWLKTRGQGNQFGGADWMQERYFTLIKNMWFNGGLLTDMSWRYIEVAMNISPFKGCEIGCTRPELPKCDGGFPPDCAREIPVSLPGANARQKVIDDYTVIVGTDIHEAWTKYNNNATDILMKQEVLDRGWAGAGIWYNTIAEINGAFITSVVSTPILERYPEVMQQVREQRRKNDADVSGKKQFRPNTADGESTKIAGSLNVAQKLADFFDWWNSDDGNMAKSDKTIGGSPVVDAITTIFGQAGLFALRGPNANINPLAQLAAVGKSLVDAAILNIGTSTVTAGAGGLLKLLDQHMLGPAADLASKLTMTVAFLFLTAGFVLYYVLPFLPFVYFFFAFGTWVKSIFEAMVGVPLWALAHLRLDGEGLPGDSASSGYFLIFEIFIRPILTVFGLVAAVLILTAQVRMLNVLWDLVVSNLTGFEGYTPAGGGTQKAVTFAGYKVLPRNTIDQFFFTIVYAIIVYMMATASFKMIDKIPDQLLRFMGAGVSAFSDINPDPTEGLTRYAAIGGITVSQQVVQGLQGVAKGGGDLLAGEFAQLTQAVKGKQ